LPIIVTSVSEFAGEADVIVRGIAQQGPGRVTVFGERRRERTSAYLAHFDGHALVVLPAPPTENVSDYVEEEGGVGWAVSSESDTPWRHEPSGPWQPVALPLPYRANRVWLADDGAVWVGAYGPLVDRRGDGLTGGDNIVLFSTRSFGRALAFGKVPVATNEEPESEP
jgi:hypothetical protein